MNFFKNRFFNTLDKIDLSIWVYSGLLILLNVLTIRFGEIYFDSNTYENFVLIRRYSGFLILIYSFGQNNILRREILWNEIELNSDSFNFILIKRIFLSYVLTSCSSLFIFLITGFSVFGLGIFLMSIFMINQIYITIFFRLQGRYNSLSLFILFTNMFFLILIIALSDFVPSLSIVVIIQVFLLVFFLGGASQLKDVFKCVILDWRSNLIDIKRGMFRSVGDIASESSVVLIVFLASLQHGAKYGAEISIILTINQLISTLFQPATMKMFDDNISTKNKYKLNMIWYLRVLFFALFVCFMAFVFRPIFFNFFVLDTSKINIVSYYCVVVFSLIYSLSILMKNLLDSCSNDDGSIVFFIRVFPVLIFMIILGFKINYNLVIPFVIYHLILFVLLSVEYNKKSKI